MSIAYPPGAGKVMGSIIGQNRVKAKDVKSCTYCCYVRCASLIVWVKGMPLPQAGATQYHAQLELPDKGRAIKGSVICNDWNLKPLDLLKRSGPRWPVLWGMTRIAKLYHVSKSSGMQTITTAETNFSTSLYSHKLNSFLYLFSSVFLLSWNTALSLNKYHLEEFHLNKSWIICSSFKQVKIFYIKCVAVYRNKKQGTQVLQKISSLKSSLP